MASDVLGKSGRAMLRALAAGETDPDRLAEMALGRLRKQIPKLRPALTGRVTDHHRFLLGLLLDEVEAVEGFIDRMEARITAVLGPFAPAVRWLRTIPGVDQRTAEVLVAEVSTRMDRLPSEGHLASWAGMCPGNDESAGKKRSGRTPRGNPWLKRGWSRRRGRRAGPRTHLPGGAVPAVGGPARAEAGPGGLLGVIYHVLRDGAHYAELGGDYFERRDRDQLTRRLIRRLERLGVQATIQVQPQAA